MGEKGTAGGLEDKWELRTGCQQLILIFTSPFWETLAVWTWSPRGRGRCGQHLVCPGLTQVEAAQVRALGREQTPGDTEPSLRALVGVAQAELSLFQSLQGSPSHRHHQGGTWMSQLVRVHSCRVAMTKDQDLVEWSLFDSVGLGII